MGDPMTLNDIIIALKLYSHREAGKFVYFEFCQAYPTLEMGSSRCHYERLAIDWAVERKGEGAQGPPTVEALLKKLQSCIGMTIHGYKGGDYTVRGDLPVHVDGYGECTSTVIDDVNDVGWCVLLRTRSSR